MGSGILVNILRCVAMLPLGVLYPVSSVAAFLTYHVIRYRRRVVHDNLTQCFQDKNPAAIRAIERRFYRNLTDYIFETLKLLHISDKEIKRRMTFSGVELMDNELAAGRNIVIYFAHTGNWEWAPSVCLHSRYHGSRKVEYGQIYRPLRNKTFDALMLEVRSRFGSHSIPKQLTLRHLLQTVKSGCLFETGFMADQKPSHGDPERIVSFMNRPTAVITGTETLARRMDTAVFYWDMSKPSRGHYHIDIIPIATQAGGTRAGQLTTEYFRLLEKTIRRQPDIWLWSHRRWKTSPATWQDVNPVNLLK